MLASSVLLRLLLTLGGSILFGLERQRSHKPIGFSTFTFVAVGACALGIVAISDLFEDSVPLLAAIVTGIGFLGAGALVRSSDRVFGFTTAAAIWLFAIFGLVIGIGEYIVGATVYALVWVIVLLDKYLEHHAIGPYQRRLIIRTNTIINEQEIRQHIKQRAQSHRTISFEADKHGKKLTLVYLVSGSKEELHKLVQTIYREPWLESCKVE